MWHGIKFTVIGVGLILIGGCSAVRVQEVPPAELDLVPIIAKVRELYNSGESGKAMEIINGVLQIRPENWRFHELRGEVLLDMGEYQKAIASLEKAEQLNSWAFTAYLKEGVAYSLLGEEKEAEICLKKGIKTFRDYPYEKGLSQEVLRLTKDATKRIMEHQPPIKIAVLNFDGDYEAIARNYNRFISNLLIKKLAKQKYFQVRGQRSQSKFLEKYSLAMQANPGESLKVGKILKVDWIVVGKVSQDLDSFQINVKMLNVSSGAIAYEDSIDFSSNEDIETRCREIADRIIIYTI